MVLAEVPVHVARDLTPSQVKAYRLMDNRSHDEATWDLDLIGPELQSIQELDSHSVGGLHDVGSGHHFPVRADQHAGAEPGNGREPRLGIGGYTPLERAHEDHGGADLAKQLAQRLLRLDGSPQGE